MCVKMLFVVLKNELKRRGHLFRDIVALREGLRLKVCAYIKWKFTLFDISSVKYDTP